MKSMVIMPAHPLLLLLLLVVIVSAYFNVHVVQAAGDHDDGIQCMSDDECERLLGEGSTCTVFGSIFDDDDDSGSKSKNAQVDDDGETSAWWGRCTNPLSQGCFYTRMPDWTRKRVCNSDDPPNAAEIGICERSEFEDTYLEVRIASADWESITLNAWLLQIVLSELLRVPTTIEPALLAVSSQKNFYHPKGLLKYGTLNNVDSFQNAFLYGDCRLVKNDPSIIGDDEELYRPCAHVIPEYWSANGPWTQESVARGSMEPPEALGVLAQETLFIPKFAADRDPTLLSYIGLQGEKNRQKLADTFLRPTTWRQYCLEVSNTTCRERDGVAIRPPRGLHATEADEDYNQEADSYFVEGLFTGYFRKTYRNFGNGTKSRATGHVIDYGCQWSSDAEQQLYHLDIALSGDTDYEEGKRGYPGWQMTQILSAANATKSPIILMWALPDPFYQSLIGTDMELHAIILPPVTQECLNYKRPWEQNCVASFEARVGDPRGACESPPVALHKAISTSLTRSINDPSIPLAARSPAVDAIQLFTVTSPIYGSWFDTIMRRDALSAKTQTLMRDALCHWAVENYENVLQRFVPYSYPRVIEDGEENLALIVFAIALSVVSILGVVIAVVIVEGSRSRRVIRLAQIEFLRFLLAGLFIMSIGALLSAFAPTDFLCSVTNWFVNIGFTIELAPLLVKVAAINRLTIASQRMQKVQIKRQNLFLSVAVITSLITVFLIVWTAVDPPIQQGELSLSSTVTPNNETIVYRSYYCSSESEVWLYVAFGWIFMLLVSSTVLAIQMRKVRQEFNESQTLGIMTYSHFVFAVLRLMTFFLADGSGQSDAARYRSILVSLDALATLVFYFVPKFLVLRNTDTERDTFETPGSRRNPDLSDSASRESADRESPSRLVSSSSSTGVRITPPLESAGSSALTPVSETDENRPIERKRSTAIDSELTDETVNESSRAESGKKSQINEIHEN